MIYFPFFRRFAPSFVPSSVPSFVASLLLPFLSLPYKMSVSPFTNLTTMCESCRSHRIRLDTLLVPQFVSIPPQAIPWKPEHLEHIGAQVYDRGNNGKLRPWRIYDTLECMKGWGFSDLDIRRFKIYMWGHIQSVYMKGSDLSDAVRWRAILTDPAQVAWFAEEEERRKISHEDSLSKVRQLATDLAPLVPNSEREELAHYLAANPDPELWRILMTHVDSKTQEYIAMRAEDIRKGISDAHECEY